jgi:hypothetical protein
MAVSHQHGVERSLLLHRIMSDDPSTPEDLGVEEQGAKEEQNQKIDAIVGDEVLGYEGGAHGEHSGQSSEGERKPNDGLEDRLADNRPDQVK